MENHKDKLRIYTKKREIRALLKASRELKCKDPTYTKSTK